MNQRRNNPPSRRAAPAQAGREPAPQQKSAQERMQDLFRMIQDRRDEVEAVLPSDIKYEKFTAAINMAIRRDPSILDAYGPSIIKSCIQSAYDGLLPDGKEAVILVSTNRIPGTTQYRKEARYQSMAYGLRKKIVEAGAAKHIEATVVHEHDVFRYAKGLNPMLEHVPIIEDEKRGKLLAAYSVAILPDGTKVFEVMTRGEIAEVRAAAQTQMVWDKWEAEMWRKTVLRRHTKALPTSTPIRDAEALEMFPQFAGPQAALPAPAAPTRQDFNRLGAPSQDVPLDLSGFGGDTVEHAEAEREPLAEQRGGNDAPRDTGKASGAGAKVERGDDQRPAGDGGDAVDDLPANDDEWRIWTADIAGKIGRCESVELLDMLQSQTPVAKAPKGFRDTIENAFVERRMELGEAG